MKSYFNILLSCFAMSCYGQETFDPKVFQVWEPVPKIVRTNTPNQVPTDAIILFNGENLDHWVHLDGKTVKWDLSNGVLTVVPGSGNIRTKQKFGDCQLHLEFRTPSKIEGEGQGRGNSGVFFQNRYEVQILDSYDNPTYVNGQTGAIYKQHIPLVNSSRGPGEWQTYDIIFKAPKFNSDGIRTEMGSFTVIHNGVLIQNNVPILGTTENKKFPIVASHGNDYLKIQDHKNPVSFRNIWIREL